MGELKTYRRKRDFNKTPEPSGPAGGPIPGKNRFVVQMHKARRLHYDFRLESGGVLVSWAVPRGPSLDPSKKHLAVRTEDHPLDYIGFEGVIPEGQYGAGPVIVWDTGHYTNITSRRGGHAPLEDSLKNGHVSVWLDGEKLKGGFALTRLSTGEKENWIMVKMDDPLASADTDPVSTMPRSVKSGRTIDELAQGNRNGGPAIKGKSGVENIPPEVQKKLKKIPQPKFVKPMLAALAEKSHEKILEDENRLFEPKLDGQRCLAFRKGEKLDLVSRNRIGINGNYPEIVEAMLAQPATDFIVDGEIVALENGTPSFEKLQPRMQIGNPDEALRTQIEVVYYLFDLLYLDGYDITGLPLSLRKSVLRQAFSYTDKILYLDHETGSGKSVFHNACKKGMEGVIAKRAESPYRSGRARDWLKFKCGLGQEFVIGGFSERGGTRSSPGFGFGALLIGYYEGGKLKYAGKVGTGYNEFTLKTLGEKLRAMERKKAPFAPHPELKEKNVHWVEPGMVCEVEFSEWTKGGLLRHPRFKGIRTDKAPREVMREQAPDMK